MDSEDDMHDANDAESLDDFYSGETAMASDDGDGDYEFDNDADDSDDSALHRQQQNYTILSEADIRQRQEEDITRISTVLSILSVHASILLRHYNWCPTPVLKTIDNIRRDFLWFGKENQSNIHLLDWKDACKIFREGGANVKDLRRMNTALLGKWTWRLVMEPEALWSSIIKGKYGSSLGGWWSKDSSAYRASHIWKGILKVKQAVINNISFELGSGVAIRFWEDIWVGDSKLKDWFISDCYSFSDAKIVWDIRSIRNLTDSEIAEYVDLLDCMSKSTQLISEPDKPIWRIDKAGRFTVRSLYTSLAVPSSPPISASPFFWRYLVPPKYICFAWLVDRNRILTTDNLRKRGMQPVNVCLCCMNYAESVDHLLVHCPFIRQIWIDFSLRFNLSWCIPNSAHNFLSSWHGCKLGKPRRIIWRMAILAIWWSVCLERNDRCFNDRSSSASVIGTRAKRLLFEWAANVKDLKGYDLCFLGC